MITGPDNFSEIVLRLSLLATARISAWTGATTETVHGDTTNYAEFDQKPYRNAGPG